MARDCRQCFRFFWAFNGISEEKRDYSWLGWLLDSLFELIELEAAGICFCLLSGRSPVTGLRAARLFVRVSRVLVDLFVLREPRHASSITPF